MVRDQPSCLRLAYGAVRPYLTFYDSDTPSRLCGHSQHSRHCCSRMSLLYSLHAHDRVCDFWMAALMLPWHSDIEKCARSVFQAKTSPSSLRGWRVELRPLKSVKPAWSLLEYSSLMTTEQNRLLSFYQNSRRGFVQSNATPRLVVLGMAFWKSDPRLRTGGPSEMAPVRTVGC